jgi:hypothetical protein
MNPNITENEHCQNRSILWENKTTGYTGAYKSLSLIHATESLIGPQDKLRDHESATPTISR